MLDFPISWTPSHPLKPADHERPGFRFWSSTSKLHRGMREKPSIGGFSNWSSDCRRTERIWIKLQTYLYKIQTDFKVKEEHNLILMPEEKKKNTQREETWIFLSKKKKAWRWIALILLSGWMKIWKTVQYNNNIYRTSTSKKFMLLVFKSVRINSSIEVHG